MRYKEVKGHLPLAPTLGPYLAPATRRHAAIKDRVASMKHRAIYKTDGSQPETASDKHGRASSGSSAAKDPEKAVETVRAIPARTISD
jgi:high-affinity iron transporter